MKRTNINKCKRVGNRIDNIIGKCSSAPTPDSWNCTKDGTCVDPGDGSGFYTTKSACELSEGCKFNPKTSTVGKLILWMEAVKTHMLINTPFISKWNDVGSGSLSQYNSGGGLGTVNHPQWDNINEYVMFDGGDYMTTTSTINLKTATLNGWCIAISTFMDDWANPVSGTNVVVGDDNSNNGFIKFVSDKVVHTKLFSPTLSSANLKSITIDNPVALVNNKAYVFIFNMDPATNEITLFIDGVAQTNTFNFPMTYDFHELDEIGAKNSGSLGMAGGIKEYMVYQKMLTPSNITDLNAYMFAKI
tara:strand:- start:3387 stop:4295 length:909 start_codon:yes stop_codon:yes gene_type:complete